MDRPICLPGRGKVRMPVTAAALARAALCNHAEGHELLSHPKVRRLPRGDRPNGANGNSRLSANDEVETAV
jgi:hypothetical protein